MDELDEKDYREYKWYIEGQFAEIDRKLAELSYQIECLKALVESEVASLRQEISDK